MSSSVPLVCGKRGIYQHVRKEEAGTFVSSAVLPGRRRETQFVPSYKVLSEAIRTGSFLDFSIAFESTGVV